MTTTPALDRNTSARIDLLRVVMIFGVVALHTPLYVPMAEVGPDAFGQVKAFFQQAFFRGAVPVLTAISGYLLFAARLDERPGELARKKGRAILIPFLAFNLGLLAATYGAHLAGIDLGVDFGAAGGREWADLALGLTGSPVNYPLNFLRDMLVLLALSPALGMLVRYTPVSGLAIVVMIFMGNVDGFLILRSDMPVVFYAGALAAVRNWNLRALDFAAWPLLGLFVALCAAWVALQIENTNVLRFAAPLCLWPAASIISDTAFGRLLAQQAKYSFFVFLAHAPLLALSWMVYSRIPGVSYPVYWFCTPFAVCGVLALVYEAAMRLGPRAFPFLIGAKAAPRLTPRATAGAAV